MRVLLIQLKLQLLRGNIPASCPVSTRDSLPGLSTDIPIIVLSISDDEEGKSKVPLNFLLNIF
jgi:hypothetical protein